MRKNTKKRLFPLFLLFISLTACSPNDDCTDLIGMAPPFFATLKFIDAETGENLLLNGKISLDDIQLKGSKPNRTSTPPKTDIPPSTISLNLGTEHPQAEISHEFTVKDKPTFIVNFNAIETNTNSKCAGPRHYFYPDRESLKITDTNGVIIETEDGVYILKIPTDL